MNLILDEKSREVLSSGLTKKNKSAVRLMIKGFGWGGPQLGIVLDEQREGDIETTVDGIKFVADREESFIFENAKLVYQSGIFGNGVKIIPSNIKTSTC